MRMRADFEICDRSRSARWGGTPSLISKFVTSASLKIWKSVKPWEKKTLKNLYSKSDIILRELLRHHRAQFRLVFHRRNTTWKRQYLREVWRRCEEGYGHLTSIFKKLRALLYQPLSRFKRNPSFSFGTCTILSSTFFRDMKYELYFFALT